MPQIDDYDPKDDESGDNAGSASSGQIAATGGAGTSAPSQASYSKQQSSTYIPWQSFVDANKDVSTRDAGQLGTQVQGDVTSAQNQLNTASQQYASDIAGNYSSPAKSNAGESGSNTGTGGTGSAGGNADAGGSGGSQTKQKPSANQGDLTPGAQPQAESAMGASAPAGAWSQLSGGAADRAPLAQKGAAPTSSRKPLPPAPTPQGTGDASQPATTPNTPQANNGNPWASFTGDQPRALVPQANAAEVSANPSLGALEGYVRAQTLNPNVVQNGPQGPSDLESMLGQNAWDSLSGQTQKAQEEANALGSEQGVQALLQSQATQPTNSAFDAALINGQGGPQFQQLSSQYGGSKLSDAQAAAEQQSQNAWAQLSGDVKLKAAQDAAAAKNAPSVASNQPPNPDGQSYQPPKATDVFTQTNGANGQYDPNAFPPNFDPSQNPQYQQAMAALEKAAPLPSYADTPHDFLNAPNTAAISTEWAKNLGMTYDQLRTFVMGLPQWQWEMFARGIIPSDLPRGRSSEPIGLQASTYGAIQSGTSGSGYFEGFSPVSVTASGAGTSNKDFGTAMDAYQMVVLALANPAASAAYKGAEQGVAANASNPNNTGDPFGNRG